ARVRCARVILEADDERTGALGERERDHQGPFIQRSHHKVPPRERPMPRGEICGTGKSTAFLGFAEGAVKKSTAPAAMHASPTPKVMVDTVAAVWASSLATAPTGSHAPLGAQWASTSSCLAKARIPKNEPTPMARTPTPATPIPAMRCVDPREGTVMS